MSEIISRRQFTLKENYIVQTKIFTWNDLDWDDCNKWCKKYNNDDFNWDKYLESVINDFCVSHDVLDIEPIAQIGSSSHEASWRVHVTEVYSKTPIYHVYYQIPKPQQNKQSVKN